MKKTTKVMMLAAVMVIGSAAFAGPHGRPGRHHRDGLDLAAGIVNLVMSVIDPAPVVVAPAPVVVTPPPPVHYRRPLPPPPPARPHYRQYRHERPHHYNRPAPPPHGRRPPRHR